jgi:glutamate synthase (NADPH/NADH) small chain
VVEIQVQTGNPQTGAKSVTNFEIMPKPPVGRRNYALAILAFAVKTSSSHEEGCRNWLINTKEFISNDKGELVGLKTVEVDWKMTRTKT